MRRRAAILVAVSTVFLCMPSISSSAFYGPSTGAAKKACAENGGVWWSSRQTCTYS